MKGKLLGLFAVTALALGFASTGAQAQSAKFAATWSSGGEFVEVNAANQGDLVGADVAPICTSSGTTSGTGAGSGDPCMLAVQHMATIDVAQQKDLLIGVSSEVGLTTLTQAKGKSTDGFATLGSSSAEAGVAVTTVIVNQGGDPTNPDDIVQIAAPGPVTFASRMQELKVGVNANLADEETVDVLVSLLLKTMAAHHFNFIGVDLPQGVYDVYAVFDLSAWVAVVGEDAVAQAKVALGPRMLTLQEVRAAKDELVTYAP